ncbi:Ff.00g102620.m01.CDS01 [Fusarium sp. VM40]|nr:Ff.00g102620.m01.CDS01 [Fusarium sp. VM40]
MDFEEFLNDGDKDYCFSSQYDIPPESTSESTCEVCRELGDRPCSKAFLVALHYGAHWWTGAEDEDSRWRYAEAECERVRNQILRIEGEVLLQDNPKFLDQLKPQERKNYVKRIQMVRETNERRVKGNTRPRGQLIDDGTDDSPATKTVFMQGYVMGTVIPIRVVQVEYSYQYEIDENNNNFNPFMGSEGIIIESDFQYLGQIPRHPLQHSIRTRHMFKFILTLFISALQLRAGPNHKDIFPDLEALLNERRIKNDKCFKLVWKYWRRMSFKDWYPKEGNEEGLKLKEWPDASTRNTFARQKHMQELAWHLVSAKRAGWSGNRDFTQCPLWRLIVSSTGLQVDRMAELWEAGEEEVARRMLRSGNRKGLFVYQVEPGTEDIHRYYQQPPFYDDPLNPRMRYMLAPVDNLRLPAAASQPNAPSGAQQNQPSSDPDSDSTVDNQS